MARGPLQLLVLGAVLSTPAWAEDARKADFGFGEAVAKHFVMPPSPTHVHEVAADANKPAMVILMTKHSPHCGVLRKVFKGASKASKLKTLLDSFVVAYAEENINIWAESGSSYVPQVLFFAPGGAKLPVFSTNKKYPYYYQEQASLESSMTQALELAKSAGGGSAGSSCVGGPQCRGIDDDELCEETTGCKWGAGANAGGAQGCVGGPQCRGIDDDEMCEMTKGCEWGAASPSDGAPCQGGEQCNGIDERDMCEFTAGCTWTSDEDSVDLGDDSAGTGGGGAGAGGGGDAGHAQKPVFDPAHAFKADISEKILDNLALNDMRKAAAKAKKPFMVLLTMPWCDACKQLIDTINSGSQVKKLLDSFVTMHAHGDSGLTNWQPAGQQYVPQAHFFAADGSSLKVSGSNPQFKHFFSQEAELADAMQIALSEAGGGGEL